MSNLAKTSGIYCATLRGTDRHYVGSSINMYRRKSAHINDAKRGKSSRFCKAIVEFGEEAFDWTVLEMCEPLKLLERETFWIASKNAASVSGFNTASNPLENNGMSPPPGYGHEVAMVTRMRIGLKSKGRPVSPETRQKISQANKGRIKSPEERLKLSLARKGFRYSPASKLKMSLAKLGKPRGPMPEATRALISASKKGKGNGRVGHKASPETIQKRQETRRLNRLKQGSNEY